MTTKEKQRLRKAGTPSPPATKQTVTSTDTTITPLDTEGCSVQPEVPSQGSRRHPTVSTSDYILTQRLQDWFKEERERAAPSSEEIAEMCLDLCKGGWREEAKLRDKALSIMVKVAAERRQR